MIRLGSTIARLKLKGIDGGPHKRWNMWFNSSLREKPYLGLTCYSPDVETQLFKLCLDKCTGAAWLSSARVVRCLVKSSNERNSCLLVATIKLSTLAGLPGKPGGRWERRQVIMALIPRATHVLQWLVQRAANLQR